VTPSAQRCRCPENLLVVCLVFIQYDLKIGAMIGLFVLHQSICLFVSAV
jgi:hypothetical protein